MVRVVAFLIVLWPMLGNLHAQELELLVSPGLLSRAHQKYSGVTNCKNCHTPGQGVLDETCLGCHQTLAERIHERRGFHRNRAEECSSCHPEHRGRDAHITPLDLTDFDHKETGYLLKGFHNKIKDCQKCHNTKTAPRSIKRASYLVTGNSCVTCHDDVHRGQLDKDCERCHAVTRRFGDYRFDHKETDFPLRGAHAELICSKCHSNQRWVNLKHTNCLDCHRDPHRPSLGNDCTGCHSIFSWGIGANAPFKHSQTAFPLKGKHTSVECRQCHPESQYTSIAFEKCGDCHSTEYHTKQFERDCGECHSVTGFKPSLFDHQLGDYPLAGKHKTVECAKCHPSEAVTDAVGSRSVIRYQPRPTECAGCHEDIHLGQFLKSCNSCHSTVGFGKEVLTFDHSADADYRLVGNHRQAACDSCHKPEQSAFPSGTGVAVRFRPLSDQCVDCHGDKHAGQLGTRCEACHDMEGFHPAPGFNHTESRFPLRGRHTHVNCGGCHPEVEISFENQTLKVPRYRPLGITCAECHRNPHKNTSLGNCGQCHQLDGFSIEAFNHDRTHFKLTGRHREIDCFQCHVAAFWKGKLVPTFTKYQGRCDICHRSPHPRKYDSCLSCHGTNTWEVLDW